MLQLFSLYLCILYSYTVEFTCIRAMYRLWAIFFFMQNIYGLFVPLEVIEENFFHFPKRNKKKHDFRSISDNFWLVFLSNYGHSSEKPINV